MSTLTTEAGTRALPTVAARTVETTKAVRRAIASIEESAWRTIRYPRAVFDDQLGQWVSDAQVAEIRFTAFASRGSKRP